MRNQDQLKAQVIATEALSLEALADAHTKSAHHFSASDYDLALAYNVSQLALKRLVKVLRERTEKKG